MNLVGSYEMRKNSMQCANVDRLSSIPHFHAEWEMIICISGSTIVHMNASSFELKANEMVLIPPYFFHFYEENCGDYIVMCFDNDVMPILKKQLAKERPENNIIDFSIDAVLYDTVMQFKKLFSEPYVKGDFIDPTISLGYINLIMFFSKPLFDYAPFDFEKSNLSRKVIEYCLDNYKQGISLDAVSNVFGYSKSYISHVFNLNMQMSLTTFVNWLRISEACDLLGNSTKSVTDIAHEVGFGSLRAFNRVFLNYIFQTPSDYRKNGLKYDY